MPDAQTQVGQRSPARRTIVKGAAWAVPAVTLASAAPAIAASPDPGLNGWVVISRGRENSLCRIYYDGYYGGANYYNGTRLGLWIWDAHSSEITTSPSLTFHLPNQYTWDRVQPPNSTAWSVPTYVGQDSEGFYMYRTTYSGSYTNGTGADGRPEVVLNVRPNFRGTYSNWSCPSNRRQKITRSVGVNGETIAFTREVSFPQNVVYYERVDPITEATPETTDAGTDSATQTASPDTSPASPDTSPATESAPVTVETEEVQYTVG